MLTAGTHYAVFWAPGDQQLGEPNTTAKLVAILGDVGQPDGPQEGKHVDAGECVMPDAEFHENECHSSPPPPPPFCEALPVGTCGVCTPFYGVSMPNWHECSETATSTSPRDSFARKEACNTLCGTGGMCPSAALVQPGASIIAPVQLGCLPGEAMLESDRSCTPSCAWLLCDGVPPPPAPLPPPVGLV